MILGKINFYLSEALNSTLLIVAIIGWLRYSKISSTFFPFLLFIWTGAINEMISAIIINLGYYNIFNYNLYLLTEALLLTWQFKKWQLWPNSKITAFLFVFFPLLWALENLFISKFYLGFNSNFRIVAAFIIVVMSVKMLNNVLVMETKSILKNAIFIICCLLIILFTYALFTEVFIAYNIPMSAAFSNGLHDIFIVVNFLANACFAYAIYKIPKKQVFALQF